MADGTDQWPAGTPQNIIDAWIQAGLTPADVNQNLPGTHMTVAQAVNAPPSMGGTGPTTEQVMGPAVGPLQFAQNQAITGTIDLTGITPTTGGKLITWDDFNKFYSPSQQQQLLQGMGLTKDQSQQVMDALQKTEIGQYQNYLYDGKTSLSDLQQKSGLAAIVGGIGAQQQLTQQQQAQQQGANYPYSYQNLQAWTQGFLLPLMGQVNKMVQGDMNQWGSAIGQLKYLPGNVAQTLKPTAEEVAGYQAMVPLTAMQQWTPEYTNMINQMYSAQQAAGAKLEGVNATQSGLQQLGITQPGPAAYSAGGLSGTNPIGSLVNVGNTPNLSNVNQAAQANYSLPPSAYIQP